MVISKVLQELVAVLMAGGLIEVKTRQSLHPRQKIISL